MDKNSDFGKGQGSAFWPKPLCYLAEGTGFEPAVPVGTPVFKTGAFSRSATPPRMGSLAWTYSNAALLL